MNKDGAISAAGDWKLHFQSKQLRRDELNNSKNSVIEGYIELEVWDIDLPGAKYPALYAIGKWANGKCLPTLKDLITLQTEMYRW